MDVVKRLIRHEAEPSCGCGQEANKARGGAELWMWSRG